MEHRLGAGTAAVVGHAAREPARGAKVLVAPGAPLEELSFHLLAAAAAESLLHDLAGGLHGTIIMLGFTPRAALRAGSGGVAQW